MSRAFVREIDDPLPPPVPERQVSTAPNRVTPRGARLIEKAIAALEQQLAKNPDGEGAAALRRDVRYWQSRKASMQVVPLNPRPERIGFGTRATIRKNAMISTVTIVGEDEADPASGLIAWTAPLALALRDAGAGDVVELEAGGHVELVMVIKVVADAGQE